MDQEPDVMRRSADPSYPAPEPDVIRRQIGQTRSALTEKLETLEGQVRGTVESAKATVEETIENVRSTVRETVEGVKQTLDVKYQVRQHPWAMFGASVAAGFLAGNLVNRSMRQRPALAESRYPSGNGSRGPYAAERASFQPEPAAASFRSEPETAAAKPGLLSRLLHQFDDEIENVKEVAIGAAVGWLRDMAKEQIPQLAPQIDEVMNSAVSKLGGRPIHQSMVEPEQSPGWHGRTSQRG
jgi:ElaB/YqjD/DUF883 family membrane-anchored ribosome-binding protein